ncbi:DUF4783 domain-containing protein [Hymenobacter sp. UV11]|uniref:DUF4783 domain-containing protein n=1 Tax=Hymenobacter sp. UV11 TaxID=1849735 RepID=UPI00105E3536|nr:DUF4783 domain-containing protein [Hymenobacter sp. UV11]TDN39702.1 hypothetical protein A8B98_17140 [Hymenobacter sp. UV11]TFZ67179.1 DUF4783 domain-containing protein [Hymenobacter sp. UV11]
MKIILTKVFLFGWLLLAVVVSGKAQNADQLGAVRSAISSGSSRNLAQYLGPSVEVGFDGDKQSYNATQTELVMKNFFTKNPPASFDIVHQGASNDGIPYAVGHYVGKTGNYQIFIKLKPKQSTPMIDTLDFTKE